MGIGTGDSGVRNLGSRAARLEDLEDYIGVIRKLWAGEPVLYRGAEAHLVWFRSNVPVCISAAGPKTLQLSGKIADGIVALTGILTEVVKTVQCEIVAGAREYNRDTSELDIWFLTASSIEDNYQRALQKALPSIAAVANASLRFGVTNKQVPPELEKPVNKLIKGYQYTAHNLRADANPNALLLRKLGLTDYMTIRFGIVGTPEDCAKQLLLASRAGVKGIIIRPQADDRHIFLRRWRDEVIPAFEKLLKSE